VVEEWKANQHRQPRQNTKCVVEVCLRKAFQTGDLFFGLYKSLSSGFEGRSSFLSISILGSCLGLLVEEEDAEDADFLFTPFVADGEELDLDVES